MLAVEYDGQQHRTSSYQFAKDAELGPLDRS